MLCPALGGLEAGRPRWWSPRHVGHACWGRFLGMAELGDVAQLGEHLLCTQGVRGSSPLVST
jgi:hypothetical protein